MATPLKLTAKEMLEKARALGEPSLPKVKIVALEPPDPNNPFGAVPQSAQGSNLQVTFDASSLLPLTAGNYLEFWLCWITGSTVEEADYLKIDFPSRPEHQTLTMSVPQSFMINDGPRTLVMVVNRRLGNPRHSYPTDALIDNTAPHAGFPPNAIDIIEPGFPFLALTTDYLDAHPTIRCRIGPYNFRREKDEAHLIISSTNPPPNFTSSPIFKVFDTQTEALEIDVDASYFRSLKNGPAWISYKLKDRYGNFGALSLSTPFNVSFGVVVAIDPPTVSPLFAGLLNRSSARSTVQVGIPVSSLLAGDQVGVTWDGIALPGLQTFNGAVLSFPVVWTSLIANGLGPRTAKVSYRVIRGASSFSSLDVNVPCDFTVAGRDHPLAPAILNALLNPVEIYGQGSTLKNQLTKAHVGQPVTARLLLGANYTQDQLLTLNTNSGGVLKQISTYRIKATDVPGSTIEFDPVPWSVFDGQLNTNNFPINYTTFNNVNLQLSVDTAVILTYAIPERLRAPHIQGTRFNNYLSCLTAPPVYKGVSVNVLPNAKILANDIINLTWTAYSKNNWKDVLPLAAGQFSYQMTPADLALGHTFNVAYTPYLSLALNKGSIEVEYEVIRAGAVVYGSLLDNVRVDLIEPATGKPCKT